MNNQRHKLDPYLKAAKSVPETPLDSKIAALERELRLAEQKKSQVRKTRELRERIAQLKSIRDGNPLS